MLGMVSRICLMPCKVKPDGGECPKGQIVAVQRGGSQNGKQKQSAAGIATRRACD